MAFQLPSLLSIVGTPPWGSDAIVAKPRRLIGWTYSGVMVFGRGPDAEGLFPQGQEVGRPTERCWANPTAAAPSRIITRSWSTGGRGGGCTGYNYPCILYRYFWRGLYPPLLSPRILCSKQKYVELFFRFFEIWKSWIQICSIVSLNLNIMHSTLTQKLWKYLYL